MRFHQALAEGLSGAPWDALPVEAVRQRIPQQEGIGCADAACVAQAQRVLEVPYAATAQIEVLGKNYAIDVALQGQNRLGQATGRCDICTLQEALAKTTDLTRQAALKAAALIPAFDEETSTGREALSGSSQEQRDSSHPATTTTTDRGRSWPLWPVFVAGGLGAASLGVGIPLIMLDGRGTNCRGAPRDDYRNCERLYKTSNGGWALTGIGIASLASAGVLLYLHWVTRSPERSATERSSAHRWSGEAAIRQIAIVPTTRGLMVGTGGIF